MQTAQGCSVPPVGQINGIIYIFLLYALLCCIVVWCRKIETIHCDNEKGGKKPGFFLLRFTEFVLSFDFASCDHVLSKVVVMV